MARDSTRLELGTGWNGIVTEPRQDQADSGEDWTDVDKMAENLEKTRPKRGNNVETR